MMRSHPLQNFAALLFAVATAFAHSQFSGTVVAITDGDTIHVLHDGTVEKIRLNGIDAPERKQPFSTQAQRFGGDLAFGKTVTVRVVRKDRYGRSIADVILPDGRILDHEMVKAGLAWWYRKFAPRDAVLERLESTARAAHVGLWADRDAVPPWEWRSKRKSGGKPLIPMRLSNPGSRIIRRPGAI